jgi:ribosomal protein L11 methylase PrmA
MTMMKMMTISQTGASFRDPSGFIFTRDGVLYRQVNPVYSGDYTQLMDSGLYAKLVETGRLLPHAEVEIPPATPGAYKILRPERLSFISYPYEWCFSQLKDAALATLSIQKRALKYDMSLKDASAYNIQFYKGKAALMDTLSFETYQEGEPWVAYRQFCQHFLAPLALMAWRDVRLGQLLRVHLDGIPLDLASRLLPGRTRFNLGLSAHIHLHASAQKRFSEAAVADERHGRTMNKQALLGLIENLQKTVRALKWTPGGTEWGQYYEATNYSDLAFDFKKQLVTDWCRQAKPGLVWDLGANNGVFSRLAAEMGAFVVASDIDPAAVEQNWKQVRQEKRTDLLPLLLDLTNPSSAIGWDNRERDSFSQRGPADLLLALALIHHLAISNNLPFEQIAHTFAAWGEWLVIEFVPKTDSQVQKLLRSRKDIFENYQRQAFEAAFKTCFTTIASQPVPESERWLYLMKKVDQQ